MKTHSSMSHFKCELCDFSSDTQSSLYMHESDIHKKSKYQCSLCSTYFTKPENLDVHKFNKHNIGVYPCNDCGYKATSLTVLDDHIENEHVHMKRDKNVDIRDLSNRIPCDPYHPSHTSECCDRSFNSKEEKRSRGQCKYWSQGRCFKGTSCRFAHIELCRFQDKCLNYEYCGYLHYSEQKIKTFLEPRLKSQFTYRKEDFPPLGSFQNRKRNQ